MRQLIMWNLQTLDGSLEGAQPWDLDFHEIAWGEELQQFSIDQGNEVGTLLFGRVTYEGMAKYWSNATGAVADFMNSVPKVVFSRTLDLAGWKNTRLIPNDAVVEVARLKQEEGKDMFVFGSGKLCDSLRQAGLFDEYRICIAPIVLGKGTPLFKPSTQTSRLKLLDSRTLATGAVILRYAPA